MVIVQEHVHAGRAKGGVSQNCGKTVSLLAFLPHCCLPRERAGTPKPSRLTLCPSKGITSVPPGLLGIPFWFLEVLLVSLDCAVPGFTPITPGSLANEASDALPSPALRCPMQPGSAEPQFPPL